MLGFDHEQLVSLDTLKSVQEDMSRRGLKLQDLDGELVQRLSSLGGDMEQELASLMRSNQELYQEAMFALQGQLGNQGVADLHQRVAQFASEQGEKVGQARDEYAQALEMGREGAEIELPFRSEMEDAFGINFSDVTARVSEAANDLIGSEAFQQGQDIVFGDRQPDMGTVAHELAHVVQQRDSGPSQDSAADGGQQVTERSSEIEAEADRLAAEVVQTGRAPQIDTSKLASDAISMTTGSSAQQTPDAPDEITLDIGGIVVRLDMPGGDSTTDVHIDINEEPVTGLNLVDATLNFDENWEVTSGQVNARVELGDYVQKGDVTLEVTEGGDVEASISDCELTVANIISSTIDVSVASNGMSASGSVSVEDITLPLDLTLTEGELSVSADTSGAFSANGTLTGEITGLGSFTFEARMSNEDLSGSVTVSSEAITFLDNVTLNSGEVEGNYTSEGIDMSGEGDVTVRDFNNTHLSIEHQHPAGLWSGNGRMEAPPNIEIGGVAIEGAYLDLTVDENALTNARVGGTFTTDNIRGQIDVDYDVSANSISGSAAASLQEEMDLGEGITLSALAGRATFENNTLTEITGSARAMFPYQGEDTFDVQVTDGQFNVDNLTIETADVTVTTTRDLTFGNEGGTHVVIPTGATGSGSIAQNSISELSSGISFAVNDGEFEIGTGSITSSFDPNAETANIDGDFTLSNPYGLPDRENGPVTLLPGSTISASVVENTLQAAEVSNLGYEFANPAGEGKVVGELNGSVDFEASEANVSGNGRFDPPWGVDTDFGRMSLTGGSFEAQISENELQSCSGEIGFETQIETDEQTFDIAGSLSGSYERGGEGGTETIEGEISAHLQQPISIDVGDGDRVDISANASAGGTITAGTLDQITIGCTATYYRGEDPFVTGEISEATYELDSGNLSFEARLSLDSPIETQIGETGYSLSVTSGELDCTVVDDQLTRVGGDVSIDLSDTEGPLFTGSLTQAEYLVDENTFSGTLGATTARPLDFDIGAFNISVREGSGVTGNVQANSFSEVTADFTADVTGEGLVAEATIGGTYEVPDQNFVEAEGTFSLTEDFELISTQPTEGTGMSAWTLAITQGSGIGVRFANNQFQDAAINVGGTVKKEGEQVAEGNLAGTYNLGNQEQGFTGTASAQLTDRIPLVENGTRFNVDMGEQTSFEAQVAQSRLTQASGSFQLIAKEGEEDKVSATVEGTYNEQQGLSGEATVTVLDDILLAERGEFSLTLAAESGGSATVAENELTNIHGNVNLRLDKGGEEFANGTFEIDYNLSEGSNASVNATGTVELVGELEMGTVGDYTFFLTGGSGVSLTLEDSALKTIEGTINVRIDDSEGEWIGVQLDATYEHGEQPNLSGTGEASVLDERDVGTVGEFSFQLKEGTGATATLENNDITEVGGTINVGVKRGDEDFATIELNGSWSEQDSFSGDGSAELLAEIELGTFGGYTATVEPSTEAHFTLESGSLTEVGGTLKIRIDEGEAEFIRVEASGDMTWPEKEFTGSGSATVLANKELATVAGQTLWLLEGTGATATVEANELQEIGGNINMRIDDEDGPYMTATLEDGTFDMAGGTGFSGTGSITITRDKRLAELGGYQFWLAEGAGATATIDNNRLTEVGGNVPFKIYNEASEDPLIVGHAEGTYTTESRSFTGTGDIRLGRTVSFDLPGGSRIDFLEGSGGNGTVTENELQSLGGNLMADLFVDNEQLLHIEGDGEYDAVNNDLIRLHGEATITRDWELFGGEVVVSNISGNATIEMNELVQAGGEATVSLPNLGEGVTGTFDINWENRGDGDVFWGSGQIEFAINDKISGEVDGELQRDGGFSISGEVTYEMNDMITGTIGVEMDEEFDPILSGTLTVEDVELIPGRDLFSMDRRLFQFGTTVMAGPVPVAISGGAGLGMRVGIQPLMFGCEIEVSDFHPLDMNIPNFEARADMNTGLEAEAALKPYFQVGVGASGLSAGAKIKGALTINASADLNPYAIVRGVDGVYSGEVGLGLSLSVSADIGMALALYAELGTESWDYDMWEHTIPLGELFAYDWNTKYTWGDEGPGQEDGASDTVAQGSGSSTNNAEEVNETAEDATTGFGEAQGPENSGPDRPQLQSPQEFEEESTASNEGEAEGAMGDFDQKMEDAKRYGSIIQGIAEGFGVLMNALSIGAMIPPPFGIAAAGLYLTYKHISGEYTFQDAKQTLEDTWALIQEIGPDIVDALLPDWATEMYNFVQENGVDGAIRSLADWVREELSGALGAYWPVIEPLCDFFTDRLDSLADIIERLTDGNITLEDVLDTVWDVLGMTVGAPLDLIRSIGRMLGRVGDLINMLIDNGEIWVRRLSENWGRDDFEWGINIPGLYTDSGDSWAVAVALENLLGVPVQE